MIKMLRQSIRELRNTKEGISALFCVFAATRPDRVATSASPMPAVGLNLSNSIEVKYSRIAYFG